MLGTVILYKCKIIKLLSLWKTNTFSNWLIKSLIKNIFLETISIKVTLPESFNIFRWLHFVSKPFNFSNFLAKMILFFLLLYLFNEKLHFTKIFPCLIFLKSTINSENLWFCISSSEMRIMYRSRYFLWDWSNHKLCIKLSIKEISFLKVCKEFQTKSWKAVWSKNYIWHTENERLWKKLVTKFFPHL